MQARAPASAANLGPGFDAIALALNRYVEVEDRPGVLADLTRKISSAGVDLDLVYVATRNRIVFGSPDLAGLRAALQRPS